MGINYGGRDIKSIIVIDNLIHRYVAFQPTSPELSTNAAFEIGNWGGKISITVLACEPLEVLRMNLMCYFILLLLTSSDANYI